ncbi:uncharacterized protein LOC129737700 [Uranotaenia lowii]|uniref:uncharacterized protein LOC129737700 n=1 Tax=Uranotaenia lowii TaxID=190385 RepID=UPI002479543B|nr:uncharacterized protein LOC129737700 [Uranotaenia lowii]
MAFTDILIVGSSAIEELIANFNVIDIDDDYHALKLKYAGVTVKMANGGRKVASTLARLPDWGSTEKGPFKYYGDQIWLDGIKSVLSGQISQTVSVPRWRRLALECTTGRLDHPGYIESLSMMCSYDLTKVAHGKTTLVDGGILNINQLLAYVIWIPGLHTVHRLYCCNPDDGIVLKTRSETAADKQFVFSEDEMGDTPKRTAQQVMQFAYALMLLCTENIADDSHVILESLLSKRFQAISFVMNSPAVQINDIKDIFAYEDLLMLQKVSSHYPKLRSCIFRTLLKSPHAIAKHMSEIFRTSSMTQFTFIHEFVTAPNPTMLHIDHQVVAALCKWWEVAQELIRVYDDMWIYYKLICPDSTKTTIAPFRTAAIAAMSWKKATNNAESLNQIKGVKTDERYIRLAQKVLPPECVKGIDFTGGWLDKAKDAGGWLDKAKDAGVLNWDKIAELVNAGEVSLE